jgi:peptide/nickel transport system ATP-binding protein
MYLGRIVESAPTNQLLNAPRHPYSKALTEAIPVPDPNYDRKRTDLKGSTPEPDAVGNGCRFKDRCPERMDVCDVTPEFLPTTEGEGCTACHLYYDHAEREDEGEVRSPADD